MNAGEGGRGKPPAHDPEAPDQGSKMAQALQEQGTAIEPEAAVRGREDAAWAREEAERVVGTAIAGLETQNNQLREANEKLVLATLTSQELREAAQMARQRQDEFLAMLAHELRNPLGPIRTAVELLERVGDGQPTPRPVLAVIKRQVEHMVRLLDDLLDVARVTQGKVTLERRPTAVSEFIQRAVEVTDQLINERQQRLTLDLPVPSLFVDGDPVRLTQVITNLLQNASKYTPHGGAITLRAELLGEVIVVRVIDDGMGISANALPFVFDLFAQDERTQARSQGGLGIGLTVVHRMVGLHDGTVEARSGGRGKGSEFIVTLPRLEREGEAALPERAVDALAPSAARILMIEDNVEAGEMLAELLTLSGHEVEVALGGPNGLQVFERFGPQIVLCDIGLPGMDGYEVARNLRARRPEKAPTLIALTGYGSPKDHERSRAAGFDHHVVKPVDLESLLRLIDSAVHGANSTKGRGTAPRTDQGEKGR